MNIKSVDSHRNGVAGRPFLVAVVDDPIIRGEQLTGRFLYIEFSDSSDGAVAVLNLDMAHQGNIYSHRQKDAMGEPIDGTGGNAWRGDRFHGELSESLKQEYKDKYGYDWS